MPLKNVSAKSNFGLVAGENCQKCQSSGRAINIKNIKRRIDSQKKKRIIGAYLDDSIAY